MNVNNCVTQLHLSLHPSVPEHLPNILLEVKVYLWVQINRLRKDFVFKTDAVLS